MRGRFKIANLPQPQSWTASRSALSAALAAGAAGFSKTFPPAKVADSPNLIQTNSTTDIPLTPIHSHRVQQSKDPARAPTIAVGVGVFTIRSILTLAGGKRCWTTTTYWICLAMKRGKCRRPRASSWSRRRLQTSRSTGSGASSQCGSFRNLGRWATSAQT